MEFSLTESSNPLDGQASPNLSNDAQTVAGLSSTPAHVKAMPQVATGESSPVLRPIVTADISSGYVSPAAAVVSDPTVPETLTARGSLESQSDRFRPILLAREQPYPKGNSSSCLAGVELSDAATVYPRPTSNKPTASEEDSTSL